MIEPVSFSFAQMIYPSISFEIVGDNLFQSENNDSMTCAQAYSGHIEITDKKNLSTILKLFLEFKQGDSIVAILNITCLGLFETQNEFTKENTQKIIPNFYAIIFPFARETAHNIAAKSSITFMLPPVNFLKLLETSEESFTFDSYEDS